MTLRVHPDDIVANSSNGLLAKHPSWQRVRIREIANIRNGFAFKSAQFNSTGEGVPLIRIRDVGRDETDTFFSGDFDDEYWVDPGDLIIGMDGDFRVARWQGRRALLNQRVCRLRVFRPETYDQGFLLHVLPAYLDAIWQHTSSVTVKHLSSRTVAEIPVPLPSREEQRRIVDAIEEQFSRLDAAGESLRRAKVNLQRLKSAQGLALFNGNWPNEALKNLTEADRPICYGILMPKDHRPDGVPYVRVKDYPRGRIELSGLRRTSHEIAAKYRRSTLREGDVLLAIRGTYGRVAIVPQELSGGNITQDTARISPTKEASAAYLAAYLRSETAQRYYRRVARGVAVRGVNLADVKEMPVPLPSLEDQAGIAAQSEHVGSLVAAIEQELDLGLARGRQLRQSVLREAFAGHLVPQDSSNKLEQDLR